MAHVFISYAHRDEETANRVREYLTRAGISVWNDRAQLEGGEQWSKNIYYAIKNADSGLLLLSPASLNSAYVAREYQQILSQDKRLYIALIAPVERDELPWTLSSLQYVDLTHDFQEGMNRLVEAIRDDQDIPDQQVVGDLKSDDDEAETATLTLDPDRLDEDNLMSQVRKLLEAGTRTIKVISGNAKR